MNQSFLSVMCGIVAIMWTAVPLAAQSMYTNLGFQWASTLLAFLALLLGLAPIVFVWKGRWFREKSPFMQSGGEIMKA